MTITLEAIYENGALKPTQPLQLQEHQRVRVTIEPQLGWAERTAGLLQWPGDFDDLRRLVEDRYAGDVLTDILQPRAADSPKGNGPAAPPKVGSLPGKS